MLWGHISLVIFFWFIRGKSAWVSWTIRVTDFKSFIEGINWSTWFSTRFLVFFVFVFLMAMIQSKYFSVIVATFSVVVYFIGRKIVKDVRYKHAQKQRGCLSPKRFKHYEPFLGLDLLYSMAMALKEHRFLNWQKEFFAGQNAKTFEATLLGSRMLYSSEPENMKAMSTSVEQDFGVEPIRNGNGAVTPFTHHGTSTSDGDVWKYSRNLIKPYFDRDGYRNLDRLMVHVDKLLELVPLDNSTFDLQPLLQRWVI